jgi:small subunit ribosomal protein S17
VKETATTARHSRRTLLGLVTSAKTPKTISVEVERTFRHRKYGKYLRKRKRYLVHDEEGAAREGDAVEITSTRPLSARKRWRLLRVISRSQLAGVEVVDEAAEILKDITGKRDDAVLDDGEEPR